MHSMRKVSSYLFLIELLQKQDLLYGFLKGNSGILSTPTCQLLLQPLNLPSNTKPSRFITSIPSAHTQCE